MDKNFSSKSIAGQPSSPTHPPGSSHPLAHTHRNRRSSKKLFLEIRSRGENDPVVIAWSCHEGEYRGTPLRPHQAKVNYLKNLMNRIYPQHRKARRRAKEKRRREVFEGRGTRRRVGDLYKINLAEKLKKERGGR